MFATIGGLVTLFVLVMQVLWAVLLIKACIEIWRFDFSKEKRLLVIVILLVTNWLGICVYYFYARRHLEEWLR